MRRLCLILVAAVLLAGWGVSKGLALDSGDGSADTLSAYLHGHRLPLVEARMVTDERGQRSVLLYGFVATEYGKRDAEDQARDFMDDPDIVITNRIRVRPELLTMGNGNADAASAPAESPDADYSSGGAAAGQGQAAAAQTNADFPDTLGSSEDYANQERDDELLLSNGAGSAGVPLILAILGSGSIMPPIAPPVVFGPNYPTNFPPYANRPPLMYQPPVMYPPPPVIVFRHAPPVTYGGFPPLGPGYYPSPFPAGPAPMFPATGGIPPFQSAVGRGFGGFGSPGFAPGFGGSPGFSPGFSFGGGHR
jgi:hypothetical protein